MGEAKRRGTYEERKTLALQKAIKMSQVNRGRPSLKHVALMGRIAALMQTQNQNKKE